MELDNHDDIVRAIEERQEVEVQFRSKEDGGVLLTRRCAPMDFAPSTRAHDKTPRYHFWDFESDSPRNHTLSLLANQILYVKVLDSTFDPASFVNWRTNWTIPRTTWGFYN
jgi:hypothetical protein